jgi:hypothetical protein
MKSSTHPVSGSTPHPQVLPRSQRTTETLVEHSPETSEPECAHIVKTDGDESAAAKVLQARIDGTPLEALCGHRWVPSRDPKQLPLCEKCKDIYETYRIFNDGLNETPSE